MFMGLKFDDPAGGMTATQQVIPAGVFAIFANNDPSVLQLLPPLTITDDEVDWLLGRLREVLGVSRLVTAAELAELEARVQHALDTGDDSGLGILGYGEITLVLGWPAATPRSSPASACRSSPTPGAPRRTARWWRSTSTGCGSSASTCVPTEWHTVPSAGGGVAAYVVQPVLPPTPWRSRLLAADPEPGDRGACGAVLDVVDAAVSAECRPGRPDLQLGLGRRRAPLLRRHHPDAQRRGRAHPAGPRACSPRRCRRPPGRPCAGSSPPGSSPTTTTRATWWSTWSATCSRSGSSRSSPPRSPRPTSTWRRR